jgi:DNA processing protein
MSEPVNRRDLLTLLALPGVGPSRAVRLAQTGLESLREGDEWERAGGQADAVLADCERFEIEVVSWFEDAFPPMLREIPEAPAVLFYRGSIGVASTAKAVAIVGTRKPTPWARAATEQVADAFAGKGWTVVSGLALGVDTVAHERALAGAVPTIAVLGNGLDTVYPPANRSLANQILGGGGLLLAEVAPTTKVSPQALVKRDRLQSGLANVTVVSQGGIRSGAMHTARYAAHQGRPLFVVALDRAEEVPGAEDAGTLALLREPARVLPTLLPAWKRAGTSLLSEGPAAQPLDESTLAAISGSSPLAARETLF